MKKYKLYFRNDCLTACSVRIERERRISGVYQIFLFLFSQKDIKSTSKETQPSGHWLWSGTRMKMISIVMRLIIPKGEWDGI